MNIAKPSAPVPAADPAATDAIPAPVDATQADCKGCRGSVWMSAAEIDRLLRAYLNGNDQPMCTDVQHRTRLEQCRACPDLKYGTTCRHCGCLVAVRAKLARKSCPGEIDRWQQAGV